MKHNGPKIKRTIKTPTILQLYRDRSQFGLTNSGSKFQDVLEEVYIALDANTPFLAAFGARTALDMLIVDKIGDVGSFKDKLNKLESEGYIDTTEKELLDAVTEAGNAAAHRGYAPDEKLLNSVIDILESLFDRIYFKPNRDKELLNKARELKKKIPKRNSKSNKDEQGTWEKSAQPLMSTVEW